MIRLFYVSMATIGVYRIMIGDITRVSEAPNARHGITDALALCNRVFGQVLEGDETEVETLNEANRQ